MKTIILPILISLLSHAVYAQPKPIYFEERYSSDSLPKKVRARIYQQYFDHTEILDTTLELVDRSFHIRFSKLTSTGYLVLSYPDAHNSWIPRRYYLNKADSVIIDRQQFSQTYSGKGTLPYLITDSIQTFSFARAGAGAKGKMSYEKLVRQRELLDSVLKLRNAVIENARMQLGEMMTETLLLDNYAERWNATYELLYAQWTSMKDTNLKKETRLFLNQCFNTEKVIAAPVAIVSSAWYPSYAYTKARLDVILNHSSAKFNDVLNHIMQLESNPGRQRVLLFALTRMPYFASIDSSSYLINQVASQITDPILNNIFNYTIAKQVKGMPAYNFSFFDQAGKKISLIDLKGKTILLDFWYTGCGGCKQIAPFLKQLEDSLSDSGIAFVSVSIDRDKTRWLASVKAEDYGSAQAINVYTGGIGEENSFLKYYGIAGFPRLMIIDRKGNLYDSSPVQPRTAESTKFLQQQLLSASK